MRSLSTRALGAAEADHADRRLALAAGFRYAGAGKIGAEVGRILHGRDIRAQPRPEKGNRARFKEIFAISLQ